jgi:multimeric flavodoxin WrbA
MRISFSSVILIPMNITCLSAANIEVARGHSASVRTCELVRELVQKDLPGARVEIVPLIDYELKPCRMCGQCLETQRCARDEAFNQVFEKLIAADGVFVVVPHYAPLPSKLMMMFEKFEEISFLSWCADNNYRFPLAEKPVGVLCHGGQPTTPEVIAYYTRMLVEPVAMTLAAVSMNVIGAGPESPRGVAFGIQTIKKRSESVFVDITYDWDDVRQRIAPLVRNVSAAVKTAPALKGAAPVQ